MGIEGGLLVLRVLTVVKVILLIHIQILILSHIIMLLLSHVQGLPLEVMGTGKGRPQASASASLFCAS